MKNLVKELEKTAKEITPWGNSRYVLARADLRDLLEAAAKRIRELEGSPLGAVRGVTLINPGSGYSDFWKQR